MKHVVIIGNGIAGITAARHIRKHSENRITVISSESPYFFSRTALMYVYMGHMRFEDTMPYEPHFWSKNRIELMYAAVEKIFPKEQKINLRDGTVISFDNLIIACGSKPRKLGVHGEQLNGIFGLYHKQDLEMLEAHSKRIRHAAIVGGGLIGVELAEMLLSRGFKVDFVIRESAFWRGVLPEEDAQFVTKHLLSHDRLTLHFNDEVNFFEGNDDGYVRVVHLKSGRQVAADFVGITIGVEPNIEFLNHSSLLTNKGILVNELLQTNYPAIYAIGDCAELMHPLPHRRAIEPVWYTGRMMGECVAATICGNETEYRPGVWFNSAKFFDLEFQTYGFVPPMFDDAIHSFHWIHPKKDKMMHFAFDSNRRILGVNTFGIRLRHELFDQWIKHNESIEYVLTHLNTANFDPEFTSSFVPNILQKYNETYGVNLKPARKVWWLQLLNKSKK